MPRNPPHIGPNQWLLTLGVFLIFGPVGVFIGLLQHEPPGWLFSLVLWALSGLLAVGWSFSLNKRGWWLLLIVPLIGAPMFVFPWLFRALFEGRLLTAGYEWSEIARKVFAVAWGTVSMSLGFTSVIYYVTRAERVAARAEAELEAARSIHEQLVPPVDFSAGGLEVLGRSHASASMGGDLVDLVRHGDADDAPIDVLLGDVSGHGIRAGAVMALAKGALRACAEGATPVAAMLDKANLQVERLTDDAMFLTLSVVRLVRVEGGAYRVTCGLAGHHAALLFQPDGSVEEFGADSSGLPLGVSASERYDTRDVELRPGATVALYTDGLSEIGADAPGEMLGHAGVRRILGDALRDVATLHEAYERVMGAVAEVGAQADDQSFVLVRVRSA